MDREKLIADITQFFNKRANSGANPLAHLARGVLNAEAEQILLNDLGKIRRTNLDLFTRTVLKIGKALGRTEGKAFINRLRLTPVEWFSLTIEMAQDAGQTVTEFVGRSVEDYAREIGLTIETVSLPKGPTGEELLIDALKQISAENPGWKPYQFRRFVESRVKGHLAKPSKPFTPQDIAVGVDWFFNKRKSLMAEMDQKDPRSRSRPRIPMEQWAELFRLRGWGDSPIFAEDFQKAVRDKARKNAKRDKEH